MRFPARSMKLPLLALAAILSLAIPAAASDASAVVAASRQRRVTAQVTAISIAKAAARPHISIPRPPVASGSGSPRTGS